MFSPITEMDPRGPFLNILIWLFLVALTYRLLKHPSKLNNVSIFLPVVFIIIFLLYAMFGGDYFRYKEMVEMMHYSTRDIEAITNQESKEPIYWYLTMLVDYNYILFRTVVFVGAFGLCLLSMKIHEISIPAFLAFFIIACLVSFSVSRVCLATSIAILGYSLMLWRSKYKFLTVIVFLLGLSIFSCAFFFHKSIVVFLGILIVSLIPLNKKTITLIMILSPIITFLIGSFFVYYLFNSGDSESTFNFKSAQSYAMNEKSYGIGTSLLVLISYVYYVISLVFILKYICSVQFYHAPAFIRCLARSTFWVILFSALFWFVPGIESLMFCNRFLAFCQTAIIPVFAYSLQTGYKYSYLKKIYNIAFVWGLYTLTLTFLGKLLN